MFTAARSLSLLCLLGLTACEGAGPGATETGKPPPEPPATVPAAVTFACGTDALTLDLPCQVGFPLAGSASAVECVAHGQGKAGKLAFVVDLGSGLNKKTELPGIIAPADFQLQSIRGSLTFSRVDVSRRSFAGRLEYVALTFDDGRTCRLEDGPFSGEPGDFL